jgi:CsoR family transcriptional regulator, copper-sensing transcriptional repressor
MMNDAAKGKSVSRLQRIAGQVAGIGRMVQGDRYCVDVLLQIASVHAALHQVNKLVLRSHVETCVAEAMASGKAAERRQKLDELMEVFARYCWLRGASR